MTKDQLQCIETIENLGFPHLAELLRIDDIGYTETILYINEVYVASTREEFSEDEYNLLIHSVMKFFNRTNHQQ